MRLGLQGCRALDTVVPMRAGQVRYTLDSRQIPTVTAEHSHPVCPSHDATTYFVG